MNDVRIPDGRAITPWDHVERRGRRVAPVTLAESATRSERQQAERETFHDMAAATHAAIGRRAS